MSIEHVSVCLRPSGEVVITVPVLRPPQEVRLPDPKLLKLVRPDVFFTEGDDFPENPFE